MRQKVRIWLYCLMTLLFWFANYTFVPYLSTYAGSMTDSKALIGLMLGAYGWAQLALRIPVGVLSDRFNNRRLFIRIGCMVNIVSAIGFYFAPNVFWLIVCRTLSGVSVSVWVAMSVLFNSYFERGEAVRALTLLNACNLMGQMFSSVVAMPVTAAFGIRSAFLLAALVGVVPFLISLTLRDKALDRKPLEFKALLAVGKTRWVLIISIMAVLCQTMTFATTTGFTPQIALRLCAQTSMLAWILLLSTLGGAIFSLLSSRVFVERFGARNSLIVLLFVQAVTCLVQPLAPNLTSLLAIVFINGIARGTSVSLMLGLVVLPFPYEKQSAAMGFYQAIYSLGIILGPTIAGSVMQIGGLDAGFYTIGVIGLIAPMLGLMFIADERKKLPTIG